MRILFIFVFQLLLVSLIVCFKVRNILINEFQSKTKSLDDLNVWRNKLKNDFIEGLQKLPENIKTAIINTADEELKNKWISLTAMDYLDYKLTGNRFYEAKTFNRNKRIQNFVLGELLTRKGKYLNEVANGLWLTLEESTWAWPAHLGVQKAGVGLPDPGQPIIDLGDGERSAFVAWLGFLMGDELKTLSPMFTKRIDHELNHRLFEPFLKQEFGWEGLEGQTVNNWNTWINSNILISSLLNLNQTERIEIITKTVKSLDDWLNWYGDDGGCDEGPGYWNAAGGRFIEYIYYLRSASNNQMEWNTNELINNIGSYIYKVHIDKDYFVNFADADPKTIPDPNVVLSYGETLNNTLMKQFAAYLYQLRGNDSFIINTAKSGGLHQFYLQLSAYQSLKSATAKAPQPLESWLPDLQVVTLRSVEGSAEGLFVGAKAGNNGESHNHNDVGNFVLYVGGLPALIDIGGGTYNSKYFSKDRYTIWNLQSQWHNCPTINGKQQHDGKTYKAVNVSYTNSTHGGDFVADIADAYPKEASVKSWVRKLTFDRKLWTLDLNETYSLDKFVEPFKLHFVTVLNTTYDQSKGEVLFEKSEKEKKIIFLTMNFQTDLFDVQIDRPNNTDLKISHVWGDHISRVTLVSKKKELTGTHNIQFQNYKIIG